MSNRLTQTIRASQRKVLRREFASFFTTMTTAKGDWQAIPDEEFVTAIADALIQMGKEKGKGVALLQTLVYELQEKINTELE